MLLTVIMCHSSSPPFVIGIIEGENERIMMRMGECRVQAMRLWGRVVQGEERESQKAVHPWRKHDECQHLRARCSRW